MKISFFPINLLGNNFIAFLKSLDFSRGSQMHRMKSLESPFFSHGSKRSVPAFPIALFDLIFIKSSKGGTGAGSPSKSLSMPLTIYWEIKFQRCVSIGVIMSVQDNKIISLAIVITHFGDKSNLI